MVLLLYKIEKFHLGFSIFSHPKFAQNLPQIVNLLSSTIRRNHKSAIIIILYLIFKKISTLFLNIYLQPV